MYKYQQRIFVSTICEVNCFCSCSDTILRLVKISLARSDDDSTNSFVKTQHKIFHCKSVK